MTPIRVTIDNCVVFTTRFEFVADNEGSSSVTNNHFAPRNSLAARAALWLYFFLSKLEWLKRPRGHYDLNLFGWPGPTCDECVWTLPPDMKVQPPTP